MSLLSALLAIAAGLSVGTTALVVGAVLTGQLSIGWSNDLIDLARDRSVGRPDKPLASGVVSPTSVRIACALAVAATVPLSLACGVTAGLVHLVLVAAGWAYNLGMKSTLWSWLPYAVAFGGLPAFVELARDATRLPPMWMIAAGALLGVGAHLVNVLPDLADDAATGVRGLPHRLGARWTPPVAVAALVLATAVIAAGSQSTSWLILAPAFAVVALLCLLALLGRDRTPFRAVIAIALVDVVMLVWAR
ncbi:UbiA family prenyltransferase [Nocardioides sp.]|uniref:UbiA family prenyltransferase n=1 Tax=Nocardioides sp. TaxID=35761 RepID=UPI00356B0A27